MTQTLEQQMEQVKEDVHEMKEQVRGLINMKDQVGEMYNALMGSKMLGDGGLIGIIKQMKSEQLTDRKRIDSLEKRNTRLEIYQRVVWATVGFVPAMVFAYILQLIFKK